MKVKGIIRYNGLPVQINEYNMDQIVFGHKNGKTQILLTTTIDGEPLTFQQGDIEELQIIQLTNHDFNKDYNEEAKMIMEKITEQAYNNRKITINNTEFYVDSTNNSNFWDTVQNDTWEPQTFKIFDTFLDKDHSYIDIGAWIGPTVLYGAQKAKRCYAFEPDPVAMDHLRNNIVLNPQLDSKIHLSHQAISIFSGKTYFTPKNKEFGDSMSSIIYKRSQDTTIKVDCLTLEQFMYDNSIKDCNFIKMDIEGGEFTVLPSMKDYIEQHKPTIHLSLHPPLIPNPQEALENIYDTIISKYDYVYNNQLQEITDKQSIIQTNTYFDLVLSDISI